MKDKFPEEISFGEWLHQRRRLLDLTQQELADQVGCARITLRRIESGNLKPSKDLAFILLEKLGAPQENREAWLRFARGLSEFPEKSAEALPSKPITNLPTPLTSFIGREKEQKEIANLITRNHLVDACSQMIAKILRAAPNVHILATSREALGIPGEVTYSVPSLEVPDLEHLQPLASLRQYEAVELFMERATAAVPAFIVTDEHVPLLAQICHRLDGVPLAIELAAAKIRVLSIDQIAERLNDRFKLLTSGSRTELEHHQTLRAAIDWSYNLLSPAEQVLLRRISVFIGGWTLEAAESVCSDGSDLHEVHSDEVLTLMEQLINKSLVIMREVQHESRYRMLETLRQYANEKLVESGERDPLRDHHLDYFLTLAETAAPHLVRPEQVEWLNRLEVVHDNLRAALEWSLRKERPEQALRLAASLGTFWYVHEHRQEGAHWLESALALPMDDPTPAEKAACARALYQDAALAEAMDNMERLQVSAQAALALCERGTDRLDLAIARYYMGFAAGRAGDLDQRDRWWSCAWLISKN